MVTEQLSRLVSDRPFIPFTIHMADGRNIEVKHPEAIAYRGGRIAFVMDTDETGVIIDLLLVPSIVVQAATAV